MPVIPGPSAPAPAPGLGGPCAPWVDAAGLPCEGGTLEQRELAVALATELLWALSGRRFGASCPVLIRPCRGPGSCAPPAGVAFPCSSWGSVFDLGTSVHDVLEIRIDGEVFLEWVLDNGRLLRRLDGESWPSSQDLTLGDDSPDTWSIAYTTGLDVPALGIYAATVLGCEYLAALTSDRCKLPARLRSAARQGVSIDVADPGEYLVDGRLGIEDVDRFLIAVNPHGLPGRSSVMFPESPRYVRR